MNLIAVVSNACKTAFVQAGFKKRGGEVYTLPVLDDVIGWVGLNRAKRGAVLEINPVIGVRHQPLEKLVAELTEWEYHPYSPPSVATHLGYLMPEYAYLPWLFDDETTIETKVAAGMSDIFTYAIPFVELNTSLSNLVQTMCSRRYGMWENSVYRIPAAFYILSEYAKVREFLDEELKQREGRTDLANENYLAFAGRLLSRLPV